MRIHLLMVETQHHRFSYVKPMTMESTTLAVCDLALQFGEGDAESMSRPFGVSFLIVGHDRTGRACKEEKTGFEITYLPFRILGYGTNDSPIIMDWNNIYTPTCARTSISFCRNQGA
nr:probable proteasome subunit alpha type-5 [Ziziphus jujuba var. spinosa]